MITVGMYTLAFIAAGGLVTGSRASRIGSGATVASDRPMGQA